MNYRTGKILLITSLLLLPAAFSPIQGEEPAFSYTHIHREGSSTAVSESRTETREKSSKTTTHSDVSVDFPSAPSAGGMVYPYLTKNKLPSASVLRDSGSAYEYGVLAAVKGRRAGAFWAGRERKWCLLSTAPSAMRETAFSG